MVLEPVSVSHQSQATAPGLFKFTQQEPEADFYWVFKEYQRPDIREFTTMAEYQKYKASQGGVPIGSHWMPGDLTAQRAESRPSA